MLLAVDIGNTTMTLGVYEQGKLLHKWSLCSDIKRSEDEYGIIFFNLIKLAKLENDITDVIISCVVVQLCEKIELAFLKYFGIKAINVSCKINTGVNIKIQNPQELGADRIVNAYYATQVCKLPAIIVDLGTATTFDVINENAEFIGGLIVAGIKIQAQSLSNFTSKLPKIKIDAPCSIIANNTVDAMISGIIIGHASMIDGVVEACEKELGKKVTTFGTGGYCNIVAKYLKRPFDFINENLVLDGLYGLWKLNKHN